MAKAKGWWRVSLKMETLRRLENIRDRLQTDGETLSIDAVVSHLIAAYHRSQRS
jgi:hypothetical protein